MNERFLMKDFQAFLSLGRSFLTFLSFRSLLNTSFHVFVGCPLRKLPLTLKVLHVLDKAFSSIPSRWPNHCSLLSCKHFLMLFDISLILSSVAEILSPGRTLHIYLTIIALFLSSLITSSSLTGHMSLPYSITLPSHAEYKLSFAPKGILSKEGTKSLNLLHPLLILVIAQLTTSPPAPIFLPR